MAFKKKEVVMNPKEEAAEKVRTIRKILDEKMEKIYAELGEEYGFSAHDVHKIHRKLIYRFV